MYKVRFGRMWVKKIAIMHEDKYEVEFTTSKIFAKELDYEEIKCLVNDFDGLKIIKIETNEVDVTSLVMMNL